MRLLSCKKNGLAMRGRVKFLVMFSALAAFPAGLGAGADRGVPAPPVRPAAPPAAPPARRPRRPRPPPAAAAPSPAPPVVLPPPLWDPRDAQQLLDFIQQIGSEGLDPADYDPAGLIAGAALGQSACCSRRPRPTGSTCCPPTSRLAMSAARTARTGTSPTTDLDADRQTLLLRAALAPAPRRRRAARPAAEPPPICRAAPCAGNHAAGRNRQDQPHPPQHGSLALAAARPWRALHHRQRSGLHCRAGRERGDHSRHRAVAGAIKTPTPQFQATATGVIFNPWWEVPKSIEPEVRGKRGYVPVKSTDGKTIIRWRQPPGPSNALGRVKFVMPNPKAIYLHDTNARGLFDTKSRAYSHGCIRTEHVLALGAKLLTQGAAPAVEATPAGESRRRRRTLDPGTIQAALDSKKAVQANFPKPLPVYIVYMSSAAHRRRQDRRLYRHLQARRQGHRRAARQAAGNRRENRFTIIGGGCPSARGTRQA